MRSVILRDDDTNALTPIDALEQLYRPFLQRGLPVNLAVIPEVRENIRLPDGTREGFLPRQPNPAVETIPLAHNRRLVDYLRTNAGYHVVQHGCHHDYFEFNTSDRREIIRRLDRGALRLREAGFTGVRAFVAPYDKLSRVALAETAKRFRVISTGWFEWGRVPCAWRGRYVLKKLLRRPHWAVGRTLLLSHPGCLLSYTRPCESMLPAIQRAIAQQEVTVLVTHWWEYFRDGRVDEPFIRELHKVADYLASRPDVRVTSFDELAREHATANVKYRGVFAPGMATAK